MFYSRGATGIGVLVFYSGGAAGIANRGVGVLQQRSYRDRGVCVL